MLAITQAIELGTESVASMKDLEALNAKSDARVEKALNRAVAIIISGTGVLIAAMAVISHHK